MNFFMIRSPIAIEEEKLKNIQITNGNHVLSLCFTEGKRKGVFNWAPTSIPFSLSNNVEFIRNGDYFLLISSAVSNKKQFDLLLSELLNKEVTSILVRPLVTKEDIEKHVFSDALSIESHEKNWYIKSMFKEEEQTFNFEYSPINGKGNTSMILSDPLKEKIYTFLFELLKDNEKIFELR